MCTLLEYYNNITKKHAFISLSSVIIIVSVQIRRNMSKKNPKSAIGWFCGLIKYKKKWNPHKNSQAVKNGAALKLLMKIVVKSKVAAKKWLH